MIPRFLSRIVALAMLATPLQVSAQEDDSMGEVIVTAQKRSERLPSVMTSLPYLDRRPAVGLRRTADGVVRRIEIGSDSRSEDMRRSEVQAMLLAALDRASRDGLSLVTGELEVKEVTRENWRTLFPALASPATTSDDEDDDDSYDDDEDEDEGNGKVQPGFEDDGSTATARLMFEMMRDYGMDLDEGCRLFLEQMAENRFWVHSQPEMSEQIIGGRVKFLQEQIPPIMPDLARQIAVD